jgi:streptomycin 6-kinase
MRMLDPYVSLWNLTPDGEPIVTPRAQLLPVRWRGRPAMLKVATEAEEKRGGVLMAWWEGQGAARVLAIHDDAILLERAMGQRSLSAFARGGRDDEATLILCDAIAALHAPRRKPLPELIPLGVWFEALEPAAAQGGVLARCAAIACDLLAAPREVGALHGDIHHDNVLDFEARGWLAIDPKRLFGERGFDYANLFCNPESAGAGAQKGAQAALVAARFDRRLQLVTERSGLDRNRLLRWIIAWCGLSAAWWMGDGVDPEADLAVAQRALAALDA